MEVAELARTLIGAASPANTTTPSRDVAKDVGHISRQIEALGSTFRALDAVPPRAPLLPRSDQTAIAAATFCVESCERQIR